MNKGAMRGFARGPKAGSVLRARPGDADQVWGGGDIKVLTTAPPATTDVGLDGDQFVIAGTGTTSLGAPKANGAWLSPTKNTVGGRFNLPWRAQDVYAGYVPGWNFNWAGDAVPANRAGLGQLKVANLSSSGTAFYATTGGTAAYLMQYLAGPDGNSAPLAFASVSITVEALPDSGRPVYFGRYGVSTTPYGFGVKVESTGDFSIWAMDNYSYTNTQLSSTGTGVAAGDTVHFQMFGHRLDAWRCPSGTPEVVTSPVSAALVGINQYYGYCGIYGATWVGLWMNSSVARISNLNAYG